MLPELDGVTACKILRAHGLTLPIVGVTGNALQEDIDAFTQAGANRVMTKPVSVGRLAALIRQYQPVTDAVHVPNQPSVGQ